jgi:hypothetical protein
VVLIMQWPHGKKSGVNFGSKLLQVIQEVRSNYKTRNQLNMSLCLISHSVGIRSIRTMPSELAPQRCDVSGLGSVVGVCCVSRAALGYKAIMNTGPTGDSGAPLAPCSACLARLYAMRARGHASLPKQHHGFSQTYTRHSALRLSLWCLCIWKTMRTAFPGLGAGAGAPQ